MSVQANQNSTIQNSHELIKEILFHIQNCDSIEGMKQILEDLKEKIKNGTIDPLLLKTSSIFEKLIEMVNNSQYAILTDSIDSLFEILGIKIEEIKQFILRIEAKEALTRFLNQYKLHPKQDLIFTKYLVDFWKYDIEVPGFSNEKLEELLLKIITKKERKIREFEIPEEIKAKEEDYLPLMSEKIMEEKALQYLELVKHKFPIDIDTLIQETAILDLCIDDALKLYEIKKNLMEQNDPKESNSEKPKILGIECFSYILLLIQLGKIKIDPEKNLLSLI